MSEAKDLLKEIGDMFDPEDKKKGTIPSLMDLIANMPTTQMQNITPTAKAAPPIPTTPENVGASMMAPPVATPLSKNFPYKPTKGIGTNPI